MSVASARSDAAKRGEYIFICFMHHHARYSVYSLSPFEERGLQNELETL
jgi:hypothetical protein